MIIDLILSSQHQNVILEKVFNFSLELIPFTEDLRRAGKYEMSVQLFKSGTSIGANVFEAQNAESKMDFIHKLKIAAKESEETKYWLGLCRSLESYPDPKKELLTELIEIQKILAKIISSSRR